MNHNDEPNLDSAGTTPSETAQSHLQHLGTTAVFGNVAGIELPLHFGDPAAEYAALVQGCGLVDFSHRTRLELSGADRARFLHNMCTNDIRRLTAGTGCEAF